MNIQDFKKTLPVFFRNNVVPFVWGNQGIGKTQSIKQVADEMGAELIHLHLATQEVGDLIGLLVHSADGTVSHARPEWMPPADCTKSYVLFLDEYNRAHPDVIQASFSIPTARMIHRHKLPKNCFVVAAGNHNSDSFNVSDTSDAAWMSRFCHITLQPTVQEFTTYARDKGHDSIADFITDHQQMLETKVKSEKAPHEALVTPDRRSWLEMIAPLELETMDEAVRYEVYEGILGTAAASAFMAFKKTSAKTIKLRDILKDYSKVRKLVKEATNDRDTRFDILSLATDELAQKLETTPKFLNEKSIVQLHEFFLDLPKELLCQLVKKLGGINFDYKKELLNSSDFTKRLSLRK